MKIKSLKRKLGICNKQPGDKSKELIYNRTKRWKKKRKIKTYGR